MRKDHIKYISNDLKSPTLQLRNSSSSVTLSEKKGDLRILILYVIRIVIRSVMRILIRLGPKMRMGMV